MIHVGAVHTEDQARERRGHFQHQIAHGCRQGDLFQVIPGTHALAVEDADERREGQLQRFDGEVQGDPLRRGTVQGIAHPLAQGRQGDHAEQAGGHPLAFPVQHHIVLQRRQHDDHGSHGQENIGGIVAVHAVHLPRAGSFPQILWDALLSVYCFFRPPSSHGNCKRL